MAAGSTSLLSAPCEGEARFTSMTKRAPGLAKVARRLRRVRSARPRKAARSVPASRAATSFRLRATISPNTSSAMAGLDEQLEAPIGLGRAVRVHRPLRTHPEIGGEAGGHQQGAGVERHR